MGRKKKEPAQFAGLRQRAEERMTTGPVREVPGADADRERLIHELQVHHIELALQNEELLRLKDDAEVLLERYTEIYDFAPVGYVTLTPDGRISRANLTSAGLIGIVRSRLVGARLRDYIAAGSLDDFDDFFEKLFRSGKVETCKVELPDRGEPPKCLQLDAQSNGDLQELRLTMTDVTALVRAEEKMMRRTAELEAAYREIESYSYSVSHDLRSPLRAIDGYARMLLKKHGDEFDADSMRKFNDIRANAQMMGRLIDDILALTRLGRHKISVVRLNMEDIVREIWRQEDIRDRHINLTVNVLPAGYGDRTLIKQVYANLLSNAVKFTKFRDPALIEAGGHVEKDKCVYYVKDNGVGFDMAYYDKLFGVFQRLHHADEFEGTGIGLATVQRVIQRHGGRVWAEAKVDEGATFYFSLPLPHTHTHTHTHTQRR